MQRVRTLFRHRRSARAARAYSSAAGVRRRAIVAFSPAGRLSARAPMLSGRSRRTSLRGARRSGRGECAPPANHVLCLSPKRGSLLTTLLRSFRLSPPAANRSGRDPEDSSARRARLEFSQLVGFGPKGAYTPFVYIRYEVFPVVEDVQIYSVPQIHDFEPNAGMANQGEAQRHDSQQLR